MFKCERQIQFNTEYKCSEQCYPCKLKYDISMENPTIQKHIEGKPPFNVSENSNDLLSDLNNEPKPKFKLNPTGVYFVVSVPSIIFSAYKLIVYIFHFFI